ILLMSGACAYPEKPDVDRPLDHVPMSSKYDTQVDLADENNSHTLMVELIGSNRDVLDVGCANGYLGQVLKSRGCTVAGLEIVEDRRTTAGIFETELGIRPGDFPPQLVRSIEADPDALTYQFVVKAVVDDAEHSVRQLRQDLVAREAELEELRHELRSGLSPS